MTSSLVKASTGRPVADRLIWAISARERARGLIGRPPLGPGEALIIQGASQVHTFGVRGAIDVVFCSESWVVVHVVIQMKPFRISKWVRGARYAIELPARAAGDLRPGDQLPPVSVSVR